MYATLTIIGRNETIAWDFMNNGEIYLRYYTMTACVSLIHYTNAKAISFIIKKIVRLVNACAIQ